MRVDCRIQSRCPRFFIGCATLFALACLSTSLSADDALPATKPTAGTHPAAPVFENDVVPILRAYCWRCHGGEGREAALDLRSFPLLQQGGKSGPVIVAGSAEKSPLYKRMYAGEMPPGDRLKPTAEHVALIKSWIDSGAAATYRDAQMTEDEQPLLTEENRQWWAFQKPVRLPAPQVKHADRVRTTIDAFLLEKLEKAGLTFSPEADRATLARRLYLDVTGLPPEPEAVAAFVADESPGAYERLVDTLLASPHYGERWGRHWLDAAGYVDTIGSDNDASIIDERPSIWKYRDYVIRSFNADKPYDRFLLEQLAGDELCDWRHAEAYTPEMQELLVATGFLRQAADVTFAPELNTADIRNQVLYDTVQIFSANVLGLTVHCAQCHTHKFDPISHADYYRFAALLAPGYDVQHWITAKDRCIPDISATEKSKIDAANAEADKGIKTASDEIAAIQNQFKSKLQDAKLQNLPEPIRADTKAAVETPAEKRAEVQKYLAEKLGKLIEVTPTEIDQALDDAAKQKIAALNAKMGQLASSKRTYGVIQAFWDVGAPPPTQIHRRGNYQTPGAAINPGVIAVLDDPANPFKLPQPAAGSSVNGYRTVLAQWLTRPDHPLTARVVGNRVWQQYFGRGIVATPENFGASGMLPTHPELLDWLATEFVRCGWSFKELHRLILTSSAYRQSSQVAKDKSEFATDPYVADPENLLLWHMPLRRLDSELVRDRVLAASGTLNRSEGGPSIPLKPQPDGRVEIDVEKLKSPDDQFRRSVYIFARRNYQLTEMSVFDQPKISHNCTRRVSSAVVLQSLTMLNGKFVLEQAEHLAERVRLSSEANDKARVARTFRITLCRDASPDEISASLKLLDDQRSHYQSDDKLSAEAANNAALTDLCQMLLNSNEFLYVN